MYHVPELLNNNHKLLHNFKIIIHIMTGTEKLSWLWKPKLLWVNNQRETGEYSFTFADGCTFADGWI